MVATCSFMGGEWDSGEEGGGQGNGDWRLEIGACGGGWGVDDGVDDTIGFEKDEWFGGDG